MDLTGCVALVTGANRGIGRHFIEQLLERGAAKVYATGRRAPAIDLDGVEVLQLDLLDPASPPAAANTASDVDVLINNAGVSTRSELVTGDLERIRLDMDTNYFGTLGVIRAFAPVLAANGGGAILNILSASSWLSYRGNGGYCASKAAAWSLTNTVRIELAGQGTQVSALHVGAVDTDQTAEFDIPKLEPAEVVRAALDGIRDGRPEILVDDAARRAKAALAGDPS